ncbi:hypothetical protein JCM14469_06910 [Desulfatiferula olefinivorans]
MSENTPKDQREFPRKPCPGVMVLFSDDSHFYSDYIYDISENGMFINSNAPIRAGSEISMSFLSFHKKGPIKINGNVVRSLPKGIGVRFRPDNEVQKTVLNSFIEGFLA